MKALVAWKEVAMDVSPRVFGKKKGSENVKGTVILLMAEILHQLIASLSHYLQGFIHPRWCRISSINSR